METGKLGYVNAPVLGSSVAAQRKNNMDIQAPLTAVYVNTVPALPPQPHPQPQLPAAPQHPTNLHLTVAPIYSKQTIPFLTFHVSGGLQLQPQGSSLVTTAPTAKPKSSGKHVCRHCGRDCMKPSVLEKHLRCHTGERPYPCTTCGISFKTQSNLYKHKRTQAHARLSSESEQSSQDSVHTSSFSQDASGNEAGSQDHDVGGLLAQISHPANAMESLSEQRPGENTDSALKQAEVSNRVAPVEEQREANSLANDTKPAEANKGPEKTEENDKEKTKENEKPVLTSHRHVPLQRQEATRFSKQWESSASRGKCQSHDSTDSGFSESSEPLWSASPGSVLPGHSMESLTESSMELSNMSNSMHTNTEPGHTVQEAKPSVSEREQKTLEERISKLISENDAVVDDKHLENVRPRKTVLSKQGSIDLPVPYTYKDSFHFEMKTAAGMAWRTPDKGGRRGLHSPVPTQPSTSMEHAPLTRSSSLPFSVALLHSERSSAALQQDYVTLARRGSSGHIYSGGFATKSVYQQVSNHRPLVRQAAVDCITATEGLARNSSTEEVCPGSLSLDGDGIDVCGESSSRKSVKKKAQKFAYSKWYIYGGGTFKKMYNTTKSCDNIVIKTKKSSTPLDHDKDQGIQRRLSSTYKDPITTMGSCHLTSGGSATACYTSCPPANLPPVTGLNKTASLFHSSSTPLKTPLIRSVSLSTMQPSSIASVDSHNQDIADRRISEKSAPKEHNDLISQNCEGPIPSERKRLRTENATVCPLETQIDSTTSKTLTQSFPPIAGTSKLHLHGNNENLSFDCLQSRTLTPLKGTIFSPCVLNAGGTYGGVSTDSSNSFTKAKTSFLPKYQLKLPNTIEAESFALPLIFNQTTGAESPGSMTTPRFSSNVYQTSTTATPLTLAKHKYTTPIITPSGPTASPITATHSLSLNPVTRPRLNLVSNCPKLDKQPVTIPDTPMGQLAKATTNSQQTQQAKPSMTLIESDSAQNPLTTPIPMLGQKSSSADTVPTQDQCPPLSCTHVALPSHPAHPVNSVKAGLSNPATPCHIIPFHDSAQPATQNIFHVRTADLQICLQIISDEQLALMEPHIERQGSACGVSLAPRKDCDAKESANTNADPEIPYIRNVSVTGERSNKDLHCEVAELKKQMDPVESSVMQNVESISNLPPVSFPQTGPSTHGNEHSNVSHVKKWLTSSANLKQMCPDMQDPSTLLRPQTSTHRHIQTPVTTGGALSSTVSQKGEKLPRSQVAEVEDVLLLRAPPEQQLLPKGSVSQKGTFSEMLSGQNKLCLAAITSLSPTPEAQSSSGSSSLKDVSQHKPVNPKATCNMGKLKATHGGLVHEALSSEKMVEESSLSLQAWLSARPNIESGDALSSQGSLLFNNNSCKVDREPSRKEHLCSGYLNFETPCLSKHAVIENESQPVPLQGMTLYEQGQGTSNHTDNPLDPMTSVPSSNLEERPKDVTVGLEIKQCPEPVDVMGSSLTVCAAKKESETAASVGIPQQPHDTDKEHMENQNEGRGMDGESNNRVWSCIKKDNVLEQIEEKKSRDGEDCQFNSRLPERDPQHCSQRQTIMFGSPQKTALWNTNPADNLHSFNSSNSSVFNSAQPQAEANSVHMLQRPSHFEASIFLRPKAKSLLDAKDSVQLAQESILPQISNYFSWVETSHTQTPPLLIQNLVNSNQNRQTEDQGHKTAPTVKPLHQGSVQICCNNSISLSEQQRPASLLPEVKAPPSTYPSLLPQTVHVKRDPFRVAGNSQTDNNIMPDSPFYPFQPCNSVSPGQDNKAERLNETTHVHTTPGGDLARPGGSNKYQSLLSTDQLYGYQLADCLTTGLRLAQGSQDDSDNTSSSDDEDKLIIEL